MEKYDVVVIGGGLSNLITATYLSKRLRNVVVFEESSKTKLLSYAEKIKDSNGNTYAFNFYHHDLGGVHKGDLLHDYINRCGLSEIFDFYDNEYTTIVQKDGSFVRRPNKFELFKTYLIRRYPKQRNDINTFFKVIQEHYDDYRVQKNARLKNIDYTLPSALIEWGDLSLYEILRKYFDNEDLMKEFSLVYDSIGLPIDQIHGYNYFMKFFDTFIDGSHFVSTSFKGLSQAVSREISKNKDKIFTNRKIKKFIFKDNEIYKVIDQDDNEIQAKHYVINMRVDSFIDQYMTNAEDIKNDFIEMYQSIKDEQYINQLYVGLDQAPEKLGITERHYLFNVENPNVTITSVTNYKAIDDKSCKDGLGAILIEFIDDDSPRKQKQQEIIDQFVQYFPQVTDHINVSRLGKKTPYLSGLASKNYWKDKNINDLFKIDDYSAVNPFKNVYFIGSWLRPEAGLTGMIQTGVEYGDIIDELIYRGDDEDYFITHDELMMIISNQFIPGSLGKMEKNIQFFIGKNSYYIRTKDKYIRLYKGVSDISDIIIIATNECLYDLSVGNTTLEKAMATGSLEHVGDDEFLKEVIDAFDMGIEDKGRVEKYSFMNGHYGMKYFLALFSVLVLSNLLANYHPYLLVAPITLALVGGISYFKYKKLKYISIFDIVTMALYLVLSVLSIFITSLNTYEDSRFTTLFFATYLLVSWLLNRPVLFGYIKYDYRTDYTRTKLFQKMAGGLTFIWGFFFAIVTLLSFNLSQSYASLSYYLAFFALYLMYYYPSSYIKGNIE